LLIQFNLQRKWVFRRRTELTAAISLVPLAPWGTTAAVYPRRAPTDICLTQSLQLALPNRPLEFLRQGESNQGVLALEKYFL
jgi:hypothetical protein